jgi:hypothetical protein
MSVAEIKQQISKLSRDERAELEAQLEVMKAFDDPEYMAEITRRCRDAEQGIHVLTKEQMLARLREAGVEL